MQVGRIKKPRRITVEAKEDVCRAKYDFMTDLNILVKETATDRDLIAKQKSLETRSTELIPDEFFGSMTDFQRGQVKKS